MRSRGNKIILKFLIPYLLILIIPLLIGFITYDRTLNVIENETARANMNLLTQSRDTIDRRLAEVDQLTQQIMLDPNLNAFQYIDDPFDGSNTFRTIEMKRNLVDFSLYNNFISDIFIFFSKSQLAITPVTIYDLPMFYPNVFKVENFTYDEWYEYTIGKFHNRTISPVSQYVIEGKQRKMVTYLQSLGYYSDPYATVAILIDDQQFVELLSGLDISDGGWAYIADKNGQIISSVTTGSEPLPLDRIKRDQAPSGTLFPVSQSDKMMTTYTTSDYNGWTYVVSQPTHIVLEKVNYIKSTMLTIFLLSLIAGIIIAFFMAYRNSKPIRFLANTIETSDEELSGPGKRQDVYQLIQEGIFRLKNNNDALQEEMNKQRPLLRIAFFERLLKGEYFNNKDIKSAMERIDIHMDGQTFVVAVLSLNDYQLIAQKEISRDLEIKGLLVKDVIHRINENVFFHAMNGNKIALIFTCSSKLQVDCKQVVERFVERMNMELEEIHYHPSIGVGQICTSLEDIARSYQEAEQALEYKIWKSTHGMMWFEELPQVVGGYYYPSDVELKLMNFIKTGNKVEVERVFAELYNENLIKRNIAASMVKLMLFDIKGSIAKLAEQITIEDAELNKQLQALFTNTVATEDVQDAFQVLKDTCISFCATVEGRKKSHNEQLIEGIIGMIHSQYSSPNFSLVTISEKFNISEVYLSYFIKEQTGIIFTEYLESVRMDQAKKLLLGDKHTVKDIAEKVGYNSSNTFCRAFKRLNGISTTDYKKSVTE